MIINLDTDIDVNLSNIDKLINKLSLLEDKSKMISFITIKEFAKIRNCSIATSQKIFLSPSFPSEDFR